MDELPDLVLIKIISYLEFEQLQILGETSSRLESFVNKRIENRPLWIKELDDHSGYLKLFCVKKVLELKELNVSRSLLQFKIDRKLHTQIRRLVVYTPFVLEGLHLDQLVHLEIVNDKIIIKGNDEIDDDDEASSVCSCGGCSKNIITINLNFKNLKTLHVSLVCKNFRLIIEAPNLLQFKCNNLDIVRLLNSKTVKTLSTSMFNKKVLDYRNVSKLYLDEFTFKKNKLSLIKPLTKLRELQITNDIDETSLDLLIKQRNESNDKLKIYFKNIDVDDENFEYDEVYRLGYIILKDSNISIYKSFAKSLKGEMKSKILFLYNNLTDEELSLLPSFVNIRSCHFEFEDLALSNWVKILSSLKLNKLFLKRNYEQSFLSVLPKYCPYITSLVIKDYENPDFLFKLTFLQVLTFEFKSLDLIKELIRKLRYIQKINIKVYYKAYTFEINENIVSLKSDSEKLFSEQKIQFLDPKFENLSDLAQLIELKGNAIAEFALS